MEVLMPRVTVPWTDENTAELRRLHAEGRPRNTIAREMGKPPATVGHWAKKIGLTFDRSMVVAAIEARRVDIAERRTAIAEEMLVVAQEALAECRQEFKAVVLVQQTGTWAERRFDRPPPKDRLDLIKVAGIAAANSMKLTDFDRDKSVDTDEDRAILINLSDALQRATGT